MKSYVHYFAGAIVAVLPVSVAAQDLSGAATFGYGSFNASDGFPDTSVLSLDGALDVTYDNGLTFGGTASTAKADIDGIAEDLSVNTFGLTGGYKFANFWTAGAYFEFAEIDIDGLGSESTDSYGLSLGYASDLMGFEAFVGETDTDILTGTGVDWTDIGASAVFNIGTEGAVGGHVQRSRLSNGGVDVDLTSIGIGGHYALGNGFTGFAGVTRAEVDVLVGDVTTFGFGLGYDLTAVANFPATLSVELARSSLDDGVDNYDEDSIRFGITLPFGAAKGAPMNSVAAGAMSPNRTALTTTLVGSF